MSTLTIDVPDEVLDALSEDLEGFEKEARQLLAVELYGRGRLTTGVAARLAGMPRTAFYWLLGEHGLSPFGEEPGDLAGDLDDATRVGRRE